VGVGNACIDCCRMTQQGFLELIEASPTLRAYRREMFARCETALGEVPGDETDAAPGAVEPFVVAVAVVGVLRAGFEAPTVEPNSLAALELLSGGLVNYAPATSSAQVDRI
jgi:transcriptional regulator MftR-like protein